MIRATRLANLRSYWECASPIGPQNKAAQDVRELAAAVEELVEALRPFAAVCDGSGALVTSAGCEIAIRLIAEFDSTAPTKPYKRRSDA